MEAQYEFFGLSTKIIDNRRVKIWFGMKDKSSVSFNKVGIKTIEFFLRENKKGTYKSASKTSNATKKIDRINSYSYFSYSSSNLNYDSYYEVKIKVNGSHVLSGSFRTFPKPGELLPFSFAFTSCSDWKGSGSVTDKRHVKVFKRMYHYRNRIRFGLHLGDIFYPNDRDTKSYAPKLWYHVYRTRIRKYIGESFAHIPFFFTWDNHDFIHGKPYGADNKKQQNRAKDRRSKFEKIFQSINLKENPHGLYENFTYSNCDFFILDTRTNRKKDKSQLLGKEQWKWLEQSTRKEAAITFICSSSPLPGYSTTRKEPQERRWKYYEGDINRLQRLIVSLGNVVFITGDIHRCKYRIHKFSPKTDAKIVHERHPSKLLEETSCIELYSSGIGRRKRRKGKYGEKDKFWEQSFMMVDVTPKESKVVFRRIGHSSNTPKRNYPYENPYPEFVKVK